MREEDTETDGTIERLKEKGIHAEIGGEGKKRGGKETA